jgi:Na+-translocating ferredoxin:NAD+ oxidoreductase RNF subunit RnfB
VDRDESGRVLKRPKVFDIDVSVCMSCQICVETCPFDAIKMDTEFELAGDNRFDGLLFKKERLLKSNEYYHEIRDAEATEVDKRLAAKKKPAAPTKPGPTAAAAQPGPVPTVQPKSAAAPVKPAPAPAPKTGPIQVPDDAPFTPEQREWLSKFLAQIASPAVRTTGAPEASPAEAAPQAGLQEAPAPRAEAEEGDPDMVDTAPWHDPDKALNERMKLAEGKSLAAKLFAAMGQTDCTACGYDCKGYAAALAAGSEKDPGLCVPGAEETEAKVRELLEQAGKKLD